MEISADPDHATPGRSNLILAYPVYSSLSVRMIMVNALSFLYIVSDLNDKCRTYSDLLESQIMAT